VAASHTVRYCVTHPAQRWSTPRCVSAPTSSALSALWHARHRNDVTSRSFPAVVIATIVRPVGSVQTCAAIGGCPETWMHQERGSSAMAGPVGGQSDSIS